ncbi:methyltransferase domain-containing protein [Nisaea sp.]|uniref:class I SAM-dependent methyltransferase n=1 Tax=Nisaea sp. TaxID=2024842 RepID=UPI003265D11C
MTESRRAFLHELVDIDGRTGLEIGPLDRPLVEPAVEGKERKISYLDHLSTEGLRQKYGADESVDTDKIVEVDFICPDGDILKAVGDQTFDYIVASHVVEHVPNPIQWLKDLFQILNPGGMLFLVVPDKRFTFDIQRPLTTFGQMVEAYLNKRSIPPVSAVYDQFSSAMSVDGGGVWAGSMNSENVLPMGTSTDAWAAAQDVHANQAYYDVHVSIFTPWSFFEVIRKLIQNGILYCQVGGFSDTLPGQIEFMVGLKKPEAVTDARADTCIASIPRLPFESFMAPYMQQVHSLSESYHKLTATLTETNELLHKANFSLAQERERSEHIHDLLRKANAEKEAIFRSRSLRLARRLSRYLNFWR